VRNPRELRLALRRRAWEILAEAEATEDPVRRQELFDLSKRYQAMSLGSEPHNDDDGEDG
jgi:hypothetical protein